MDDCSMRFILIFTILWATAYGERGSMVYCRRDNKLLKANRIESVTVSSPEGCLGVCLHRVGAGNWRTPCLAELCKLILSQIFTQHFLTI